MVLIDDLAMLLLEQPISNVKQQKRKNLNLKEINFRSQKRF